MGKEKDDLKKYYLSFRNEFGDYVRLPERLNKELELQDLTDVKGNKARYTYIKNFLKNKEIEGAIDIGGFTGYFSLSLLDDNIIRKAEVYDINSEKLNFGRKVSKYMELGDKIEFKEKKLTLDTIDNLPNGDLIVCQNVLHHAGDYFDKRLVAEMGWEDYFHTFISKLSRKFDIGVISIGLLTEKPKYWGVPKRKRRERLKSILESTEWKVEHSSNVKELKDDKDFPNDDEKNLKESINEKYRLLRRTRCYREVRNLLRKFLGREFTQKIRSKLEEGANLPSSSFKAQHYHIYLLEKSKTNRMRDTK